MQHPGDACPKCRSGRLRVRTSRRIGNSQERRLECNNQGCSYKAEEKVIVPASQVWRRCL